MSNCSSILCYHQNLKGIVQDPSCSKMMELDTHEALLASNKLLSIQLETIVKRLEVRDVAQLSSNGTICDF